MVLRALVPIGLVAMAACVANDDVPVPGITRVMPDHGVPGAIVTVVGKYLCQEPWSEVEAHPLACAHVGTMMFDTTPATATSYTDAMVLVEVPALSRGRFEVSVSVAGRSSNRIAFVVD